MSSLEYPISIHSISPEDQYHELLPWHVHDDLELVLVESGELSVSISGNTICLFENEMLFVNLNVLHSFDFKHSKNAKIVSIVFKPSFLFGFGRSVMSTTYLTPLIQNANFQYFIFKNDLSLNGVISLSQHTRQIVEHNQLQHFGFELLTKSYLLDIWLYLLKQLPPTFSIKSQHQKKPVSLDESRAKDIIRFIETHYADPITLDDIADAIHVSRSECCRCMKRCMEISPFEYLIRFRIFAAANLLIERQKPISMSALATHVGFNSSSYFNKLFKKYLGCTPSQYREIIKHDLGSS